MKKLILICLILGINSVFAKSVATVLFTSKKVVANRNGIERTLSRGSSLDVGDAVITGKGALANIKYNNGTLVNIGENSNYKILAYSSKPSDIQVAAELDTGKIKFKTTGKSKETLKTPVIALAILGTECSAYVPASDKTYVELKSGTISGTISGNQAVGSVLMNAGDSILATNEGIRHAPFPQGGRVETVTGAEGSIAETTEERTEARSISEQEEVESGTDGTSAETPETAAEAIGLIDNTQTVAEASSSEAEAIAVIETAEVSILSCTSPF
ncbi:hypothetical protein EP47_11790 [Legionella norrlandica]|uniref:FecR protein domain-containing protein n=1 Tax=Legionella norrlandica TaxID=1498499 RepID=A0A0A2STL7_9GAMM|nr:FecR family protein [Legionella norrlandica]KGP64440.1 hypothetical protein EP47_11790 [Legionella norrlandica]